MKPFFTIAVILSVVSAACNKAPSTNTGFDENIKIRMEEKVDSTKRTLLLVCFTEKIYGCANNTIQSSYTVTNDKITINFIKLNESAICLTALGPAFTLINLNGLSNKNYQLEINVGATKITGELKVSATNFHAILPVQTKAQFVNANLARVPDNTVYGTVHYHTASTAATVQKYIDSLQYFGAMAALYTPGDYGAFQVEASGQIKQTQDPGYYFTRYYIFNYNSSSSVLKNLTRRFGIAYPDSLLVTLHTSKGETFYSWVP